MLEDLLLLLQEQAPTGSAPTFQEMKNKLANWLSAENEVRFPDTVRGDLINMARREISRRYDLPYNEVTDAMVTLPGTRDYLIPPGWSRPLTLFYPDISDPLIYKSKPVFDAIFPNDQERGEPWAFTVWGGLIQFGPTPGTERVIIRNYYVVLPNLIDPEHADLLMSNAWETVLFVALKEAGKYLIEDPRVPMWTARADELLAQLPREGARARTTPIVAQSQEPG